MLSVLDVFSRYTWLRPLPDKKSSTVKTRFCKILKLYGYPRVVQHDCGSEFRKSFQKWLKNKFVIVITSRPYHPQSQGKVERMNQILKRQLAFDLIKHNREGVNWARHLPSYQNEINDRPTECLKWQTTFHVYFGRRRNSNARPKFSPDCTEDTVDRRLIMCSAVRKAAKEATRHCDMRRNKVMMKNLKTLLYHVGERVLVRYKLPKHKVQRKTWSLTGIVVDCRHEGHRYKISFTPPNGNALLEKWFHVSDLASTPAVKPRDKHSHRSKYYLPMTTENMQQNLEPEFGLPVRYNPPGGGSCQFSAMAHHLANMGKQGNAATLCQEVIGYLDSQVALGNNEHGIPWHRFLAESRGHYLHRMSLDREFGDHLTLQAISELYNIHCTFFDLAVGYVNHELIEYTLKRNHLPECVSTYITNLYSRLSGVITGPSWTTTKFPFRTGTFQGDPLSPVIFILVFNPIIQYLKLKEDRYGYKLNGNSVITLPYADDFNLITNNKRTHQRLINELHSITSSMNLTLKPEKCKNLSICSGFLKIVPFSLGGKDLDSIKNSPMKFLGACVSFQSTSMEGFTFIHNKLEYMLKNIESTNIRPEFKVRIYTH